MKSLLVIYSILLAVGLTATLVCSLFWGGVLFPVVVGDNQGLLDAGTCPVSSPDYGIFSSSDTSYNRVRDNGAHLILYTRIQADRMGRLILRGCRLRLTQTRPGRASTT